MPQPSARPVPHVDVSLRDGVARLTMHGHKSVNLFNRALMEALLRAGEALRGEPAVRVVVLTGAPGQGFLAGADIAEMAGLDPVTARDFITRVHQCCALFRTLPVPSIARIEGPCFGAGMELAAACDLRIGAADSLYGMPEVQVGLPSVVEATLLPGLIGWGRTRELLYRGHRIGAAEAERWGFLQAVAPAERLDEGLAPWVEDIVRAEPGAIRTQKRLIEAWLDGGVPAGIAASIDAFSATFSTDAPQRRLAAFFAGRKKR
jgi:enoyl-CoA hydratase/carnithine racemase